MTEPIILKGKIVHGKALGRTVGMPTANICVEEGKIPKEGVYATRIIIKGKSYDSVTNIGGRPTVDEDLQITVETHIFDFDEDVYDEVVNLEVHRFLRSVQKFDNLLQVQNQVSKDIVETKKFFRMEK